MKSGDIYYADLSPVIGSEVCGIRPVMIVQGYIPNECEKVLCAAISSDIKKETDVNISLMDCRLEELSNSYVLIEQIRNVDMKRLKDKIGSVSEEYMKHMKEVFINVLG